jgi:hypothetical protein
LEAQGPDQARGKLLQPELKMLDPEKDAFSRQAGEKAKGPVAEFFSFLLHNKKWWLTPIIVILALVAVLVVLGGTGMAPFIYSLF